jgi:hypothetical protein
MVLGGEGRGTWRNMVLGGEGRGTWSNMILVGEGRGTWKGYAVLRYKSETITLKTCPSAYRNSAWNRKWSILLKRNIAVSQTTLKHSVQWMTTNEFYNFHIICISPYQSPWLLRWLDRAVCVTRWNW